MSNLKVVLIRLTLRVVYVMLTSTLQLPSIHAELCALQIGVLGGLDIIVPLK